MLEALTHEIHEIEKVRVVDITLPLWRALTTAEHSSLYYMLMLAVYYHMAYMSIARHTEA